MKKMWFAPCVSHAPAAPRRRRTPRPPGRPSAPIRPSCRNRSPGDGVVDRRGLELRERCRRQHAGDESGSHAVVVADSIDVEPVLGGIGVHLEVNGLALVDADVGGESLDARIPRAADVPFARRAARELVLDDDRVLGAGDSRAQDQRTCGNGQDAGTPARRARAARRRDAGDAGRGIRESGLPRPEVPHIGTDVATGGSRGRSELALSLRPKSPESTRFSPAADPASPGSGRLARREPRTSQVEDEVLARDRAADQDVSLRRGIERIRLVGDGPGDQSALAVVADARAARPPDGHVTRFRQLEQALSSDGRQRTERPLRAKDTSGPVPGVPAG